MRIIISSKYLAHKLNEFDFKKDEILRVVQKIDTMILEGNHSSIEVDVHKIGFEANNIIEQSEAKWDWTKNLMNQVDEQPIVLEINKNSVQIIFQY